MNPYPYTIPNFEPAQPHPFEPAQPFAFEPAQPYPVAGKRMSTKAKLLIAGAVLAVVVTVITVIAIVAANMHGHGSAAFLGKLGDEGFYNTGGDSAALGLGYYACEALDAGSSYTAVAHSIYLDNNLTIDEASKFVSIADDYLC